MDKEVRITIQIQPVKKLSKYSPCMEKALNALALAKDGHGTVGHNMIPANRNEELQTILHQMLMYRMFKKFGRQNGKGCSFSISVNK